MAWHWNERCVHCRTQFGHTQDERPMRGASEGAMIGNRLENPQ
jgi:hypothetical protein